MLLVSSEASAKSPRQQAPMRKEVDAQQALELRLPKKCMIAAADHQS
jgi:hypothetical protein